MKLTEIQSKKVDELLYSYNNKNNVDKLVAFKAPTGSGKTFIITSFVAKLFEQNPNKNIMVIIATLSDSNLPLVFAKKMNEYKENDLNGSDFEVNYYDGDINKMDFNRNSVLIFGTSSFGKNKKLQKEFHFEDFLDKVKDFKKFNNNTEIIYIRDEAHKGSNVNSTSKFSLDNLISNVYDFSIHMTATLKEKYRSVIELTSKDISIECDETNVCLLKNKLRKIDSNTELVDDDDEKLEILRIAIKKFKEIKDNYRKLDTLIKPAMLIQVSSKHQGKSEEFNKKIRNIINVIDKESGLTYLKYFSDCPAESNLKDEKTLEQASKHDSNLDVIIFKVGPATGWDIPRACMLVQLRNVFSETLNIQTLGRIMRNPYSGLKKNPVTDKYYLYSNYNESSKKISADYNLKSQFESKRFYKGVINNYDNFDIAKEEFWSLIKGFLNSKEEFLDVYNEMIKNDKLENQIFSYSTEGNLETFQSVSYLKNKLDLCIHVYLLYEKNIYLKIIKSDLERFSSENNLDFYLISYLLNHKFNERLKKYYQKTKTMNSAEKYKIVDNVKPISYYSIWVYDSENNAVKNLETLDYYGYEQVGLKKVNKNEIENIQYLDSKTETVFMKELIKEFKKISKNENFKSEVSFLAKMPNRHSELYFEYVSDTELKIRKSFVDFVVEIVDKKTKKVVKTCMIEVKNRNDLDETKTESLKSSYFNYMQEVKRNNKDIKLDISVAYPREENSDTFFYIFDEKSSDGDYKKITLSAFINRLLNL